MTSSQITLLGRHRYFIRMARVYRFNNNPRFVADCLDMAAQARADYCATLERN